jgi:hypothetical protein
MHAHKAIAKNPEFINTAIPIHPQSINNIANNKPVFLPIRLIIKPEHEPNIAATIKAQTK